MNSNKNTSRILKFVLSLAIIGTTAMPSAQTMPTLFDDTAISASAATSCCSFDSSTEILTLSGIVSKDEVMKYRNAKSVVCEEGTLFPQDCSCLFMVFKATSISLKGANTTNVKDMHNMFANCDNLTSLDLSGFNTSEVTNMHHMFHYCSSLTSLDVSGFDTSNVGNMENMFCGCSSLTSLELGGSFKTNKVTNMADMFYDCSGLTSLDVSGFNTENVTNMYEMFYGCSSLKELKLSESFETSNVTNMGDMFHCCSSLTSLDVSGFNTEKVTYMHGMFHECSSLTSLDVSRFNTSNVYSMSYMFYKCSKLESLDLSKFDTTHCSAVMYQMFYACNNLKTLKLGEKLKEISNASSLPNGNGWVNVNDSKTIISGNGEYAAIKNNGTNTYKQFTNESLTYPTNIKVKYNEKNHQVRFTWDEVEGADRYSIAVYKSGKWRIQADDITDTVYTSPKNLTPGKTYKVAIAARVNGEWDTENAIKNAVSVTIK